MGVDSFRTICPHSAFVFRQLVDLRLDANATPNEMPLGGVVVATPLISTPLLLVSSALI